MALLATALMASTFALSAAGAAPPAHVRPATLSFGASADMLAGISYGLDSVDARPLLFSERRATNIPAGVRTVAFSCPATGGASQAASITFDFSDGGAYRLVCRAGKAAIVKDEAC